MAKSCGQAPQSDLLIGSGVRSYLAEWPLDVIGSIKCAARTFSFSGFAGLSAGEYETVDIG